VHFVFQGKPSVFQRLGYRLLAFAEASAEARHPAAFAIEWLARVVVSRADASGAGNSFGASDAIALKLRASRDSRASAQVKI
jgi:hypothetical protein